MTQCAGDSENSTGRVKGSAETLVDITSIVAEKNRENRHYSFFVFFHEHPLLLSFFLYSNTSKGE